MVPSLEFDVAFGTIFGDASVGWDCEAELEGRVDALGRDSVAILVCVSGGALVRVSVASAP
jgi:hypothetical protein